ncbi:MAG: hypothetical protein KHY83_08735 [Coriobacteriia bacterium]|nr:hypothetical protein [Coriobacteriia bacterium]MBS5478732.1 hypothetical protein [Coriobacteriia bacterium]
MNMSDYLDALPNGPRSEELCFMSVDEANSALRGPRGELGGGAYYRRVAAAVLGSAGEVVGSAPDFFNFAMAYDDAGDYVTELAVCKRALELYPGDVDLLARAIDAAGECGRFDEGLRLIERLEQTPKRYWNHHYPFFDTTRFYQAYVTACPRDQIDDIVGKAMDMALAYQKYLPIDERGYNLEAELHLYAGRVTEARRVLQRAIFEDVQGPDGTYGSLVAAQCCLTMLMQILGDSTDYDLIIKVAQRGIRNTARSQPAASVGYFVYRQALALDAIICDARERDGYGNPEKVREALMTYRCAYGRVTNEKYRSNIRDRYSILCHKSGILDLPLEEKED